MRRRPTYPYPKSPAQEAGVARLRQASAAWNSLSRDQAMAWNAYAQAQGKEGRVVFLGFATKLLQINPAAVLPVEPPTETFFADNLTFSFTAVSGGVSISANLPNRAGVATENLGQKLPNERATPKPFYKSLAFHTFDGSPFVIALSPGWYAFSVRYVNLLSGQQTPSIRLETTVQVA